MRLNDNLPPENVSSESAAQVFLSGVITRITKSISSPPMIDLTSESVDDASKEFFYKYYVRPDLDGDLKPEIFGGRAALSQAEAGLIDFLLSERSKTNIYILRDHAGRGKSTLLKYISHYLYFEEEGLRSRLVPIYISLNTEEENVNNFLGSTDLDKYLDSLVKQRCFPVVREYFSKNFSEILQVVNNLNPYLQGKFPESKIQEFVSDPELKLSELEDEVLVQIIKTSLTLYSKNVRTVAILIDDADNFSIDAQKEILDYLYRIVSYGCRGVVAIRHSTYEAIEDGRRDREPEMSVPMNWSSARLKSLLKSRLDHTKKEIKLQTSPLKVSGIHADDLVDRFIDLLGGKQCQDLLTHTSNQNLHSLMRKFNFISSSVHFRDEHLLREAMLKQTKNPEHGARLWIVLHMLLGNYRGTFKSDNNMAKAGIINCFCNNELNYQPYTFFVRLHLLTRLLGHDNESTYLPVQELENKYRDIFKHDLRLTKVFEKALFRLIQSALVLTKSCKRYQILSSVTETIRDDEIILSESGNYYLKAILVRIEYLYFMKDDIDWINSVDFQPVSPRASRYQKHSQTLLALYELMSMEFKMLIDLRNQLRNPGEASVIRDYVSRFSARKIYGQESPFMFTEKMYNEYCKYLDWSYKDSDFRSVFKNEIASLERLCSGNKDIVESFAS